MWVSKVRGKVGTVISYNPSWSNDKDLYGFHFRIFSEHSPQINSRAEGSANTYVPPLIEIVVVGYARGDMAKMINSLKEGDEIQIQGETFQKYFRTKYIEGLGLYGRAKSFNPRKTLPFLKLKPNRETFKIIKRNEG